MVNCGLRAAFVWLCKPQKIEDHVLYHAAVVSRSGAQGNAPTSSSSPSLCVVGVPRTNGRKNSKIFLKRQSSRTGMEGACHYLTNRFQMEAPVAPSRSLREAFKRAPRSLRGASKAPPRTLRGGLRTLRGGCTYRRLHEDALEGSRGLLEGSVDELHVPTRS